MRSYNSSSVLTMQEQMEVRDRENMAARAFFTASFLAVLLYSSQKGGGVKKDVLGPQDCLRDLTFEWSDGLNDFFLNNLPARDWVIMFNSFWYDVTLIAILFLFRADKLQATTFGIALMISSTTKTFIQSMLLTFARTQGYNYFFPGLYSAIVPYHDILDFYYSGHLATAAILICTMYSLHKQHKDITAFRWMFVAWLAFKIPFIWFYMTALRTHYFIDFLSGICFGIIAFIIAEQLSYFLDVCILGRRAQNRTMLFFKPCPACGWSVDNGRNLIDRNEKLAQAKILGLRGLQYHQVPNYCKDEKDD